jgi:hypothetical protein
MMADQELHELHAAIDARRARISALASGMAGKARMKAVSPPVLIAAGAVGVVVEQGSRRRVSSLAETLTAIHVYGAAAISFLDWISPDDTA